MTIRFPDKSLTKTEIIKEIPNNCLAIKNIKKVVNQVGAITTYVNFAGCNLAEKIACPFCISNFQWNDKAVSTIEQVAETIRNFNNNHVTLSGGEPMLQASGIKKLIGLMPERTFSIETNGLYQFDFSNVNVYYVVTPKSVNGKFTAYRKEMDAPQVLFMFMVSGDEESPYYNLPESYIKAAKKSNKSVYIQPINDYTLSSSVSEINKGLWGKAIKASTKYNYARAIQLARMLEKEKVKYELSIDGQTLFGL